MSLIYWENVVVDPAVPFDVTFKIVKPEEDEGHINGAGAVTHDRISAHKLVLGLTSPVFRSQLSGRWGHDQGDDHVIVVEDVTARAFRTMIDYMYGIPLSYSIEHLTLDKAQELFDIVYAAKKYLIPQLNQEIVALINKTEITTNTLEVDRLEKMANRYSHLEEASNALLLKCKLERETALKEAQVVSEKEKLQAQVMNNNVVEVGAIEPVPLFLVEMALQPHDENELVAEPSVGDLALLEEISSDDGSLNVNVEPHEVIENIEVMVLNVNNSVNDEIEEIDNDNLNENISVGGFDMQENVVQNDPGHLIRDSDGLLIGVVDNTGQSGT